MAPLEDCLESADIFVTTTGNKASLCMLTGMMPAGDAAQVFTVVHLGITDLAVCGEELDCMLSSGQPPMPHAQLTSLHNSRRPRMRLPFAPKFVQCFPTDLPVSLQDIIMATHMSKMKNNAIVGNIGHFDNEIDMAGLMGWQGIKRQNIKPQCDRRAMCLALHPAASRIELL